MHKTTQWLQSFSSQSLSAKQIPIKTKLERCVKISITGGKGGVGKTSIALKASKEISQMGYRTLLIDCDFNLSNTSIKLGLPLDDSFTRIISGEASFEECLIKDQGFHLLPMCNGSLELFENALNLDEIVIDIINSHEHEYDFIFLDCPAGISKKALTLNAYCDHRWIVVTPDKSSITDSYSLVKILSSNFSINENYLLVNMYQSDKQFQKVVLTMSETIENFLNGRTHILGGIKRYDLSSDEFDTFFLSDDENPFNRNFIKILNGFNEKVSGSLISSSLYGDRVNFEQDVQ